MVAHAEVHRALAADRHVAGLHVDGDCLLDLPALFRLPRRQDLQTWPTVVSRCFLLGPWWQRRAEDDGYYHGGAHGRRCLGPRLWTRWNLAEDTDSGRSISTRGNRTGNALWGLAHRAHDGHAHHEAKTGGRLLRRDRRRVDTRLRHANRHTRLDHSHNYRFDRRR